MVRTQPGPTLRAGARWHQGPLTSALRQADPARVVGNKSSATGLLGDAAVTPQVTQPPHPTFVSRTLYARRPHNGMLGYTPAIVGIRSEAVRVIECAELLAADLFKNADQTRQRITTLGDVERHLAQLASPTPTPPSSTARSAPDAPFRCART